MPVTIKASPKQRDALAQAHGLLTVKSFHAELTVEPWKRNGIRVDGIVDAEIEQACIVTLEPIQGRISEPVSGLFLPDDSKLGREGFETGGEILVDLDGPDSPELFSGDRIDVGALAEEFFALAIDPYPRKPGASAESIASLGDDASDGELAEKLRMLFPKDRT